ncbi:hypothetical protein KWH77_20165 [Enterobacter sichuanensis]|uniref:hypothetical protein n=1 Tax=Enterobacter sichuanensis TaxID=2071710 RepID=UPI0021CE6FD6|nr:hypothetical protein [Enterobacter sichuanensis]MCU6428526.1 hypothetical protein [Enterobacter sichuanensis]
MSATTLGDLFPEMRQAVTSHRRYARKPRTPAEITPRMGTAERLKTLYPEIDSWHPVLVTKAWLHWCEQNQQDSREPSKRDERFPDYIIHLLLENMRAEDSAKRRKRPSMSLSERLDRLFAGEGQENAECH